MFYRHTPNIIGGVTECRKEIKPLMSFWRNDACNNYQEATHETPKESAMKERISEMLTIIDTNP